MNPTPALNAALAKLQADLPPVAKSKTADVPMKSGGRYTYNYADLSTVSQAVMSRLGALGLSFTARPTLDGGNFVLAYELRHESGEEIGGFYPLGRGTPQAVGGEITYARRYALCSVTGVAPEDDDDAAAASASQTAQRRRPAQQESAAPTRTAQRSARTAEPPLPGEKDFDRAGGPAMIAPGQTRALMAAFRDAGLGGTDAREARLARAAAVVGRPLASSAELTAAEASRVIDDVKRMGATNGTAASDESVPEGYWRDPETGELIPDGAGADPAEFAGAR